MYELHKNSVFFKFCLHVTEVRFLDISSVFDMILDGMFYMRSAGDVMYISVGLIRVTGEGGGGGELFVTTNPKWCAN